jgi:ribokinase
MPSTSKPIIVVGSINIDLVATAEVIPAAGETVLGTDFQIHPGGKGANQAVAVGRLNYPVQMIGRVGSDAFGEQLRAQLVSAGVDTNNVMTTDGPSGVALIVVSRNGENSIVVAPGANAMLTPRDLDGRIEVLRRAGIVLCQLEIPEETVERLAHICSREGVPLILDPAPARKLAPEIWRSVAWFTPNETEAAYYLHESNPSSELVEPAKAAGLLLNKGLGGVILKLGSRGAYIATKDGSNAAISAFPVKAIDTTAAGDAFNGAFATALMLGDEPAEASHFASAAAAISVTRKGAQPSMPSRPEVEAMMKTAQPS